MNRRQHIMEAVLQRMRSITKDNGYHVNAGTQVFEWLGRPVHETEGPAINIRDVKDEVEVTSSYSYKHNLTIQILLSLADQEKTPVRLREFMADVVMAFGKDEDPLLPLEYRQLMKSEMDIDEQGKIVGGALLEFQIIYQTPAFEI